MNVQTKEGSNQNIKSESKPQKKNAPPVFLGVTVETDQNYERNFNQLIQNGFGQAGEPKSLIQDFKQIIQTKKAMGCWKLPNSHHVTTMFIGGNKQKLKSQQCEYF